jgi:DNA-binding transcriptional ArsR family regulator
LVTHFHCLLILTPAAILNPMVYRSSESLDNVFGAIADPTRRAILQQLGKSPARVTEIARNFTVSLNAISKHIIVLQHAGLIRQEIRGRDRICSLNAQPLREASHWIEQMRGVWEERLDALERHISAKRGKLQ